MPIGLETIRVYSDDARLGVDGGKVKPRMEDEKVRREPGRP